MQKVKTIVVTNRKGGVGKTTTSTHLAGGLAMLGYRVALVDTDPQGHVASCFGMPKEDGLATILIDEDATFAQVMRQIPPEKYTAPGWSMDTHLYLLPSDKGTAMIPVKQSSPFRFRRVLRDMADLLQLDYIIVDTGPSNSMFDGSVNLAADYVLIVTECAALSFDGVSETVNELMKLNRDNEEYRTDDVKVLGIVPNKARFSTNNHRDNIKILADEFGREMIWKPITLQTVVETAMEFGKLVYPYAPYGQAFKDAWLLVEQALVGLGEVTPQDKMTETIMKEGLVRA